MEMIERALAGKERLEGVVTGVRFAGGRPLLAVPQSAISPLRADLKFMSTPNLRMYHQDAKIKCAHFFYVKYKIGPVRHDRRFLSFWRV